MSASFVFTYIRNRTLPDTSGQIERFVARVDRVLHG